MRVFNQQLEAKHRLSNSVQTFMLIGGMMLLLGLIGELLFGEDSFLWMAAFTGLFLLVFPKLPPSIILGLYRARPLANGEIPELQQLVNELAYHALIPAVPILYYIPSSSANAFAVGSQDDSAIALTDGLLRRLNLRELTGVLGHEISHLRNNDLKVMGMADTVSRMTSFMSNFGLMLVLINLPLLIFGYSTISWFGLILLIFAPSLTSLLQLALSRTREFQADLDAAILTGDPEGLASALVKINYQPTNWIERVFTPGGKNPDPSLLRTHPDVETRVERLIELVSQTRAGDGEHGHFLPDEISIIKRRPRRHWSGLWY